jgi:branched-chain amino acid transport system permease protein
MRPVASKLSLLLCILCLAGPAAASGRQGEAIVLGATVPLSGPLASNGQLYLGALRLAEADVNAAGGIAGRPLRIQVEDATSSNTGAVNALVKLVKQVDPPLIFLSSYTPQVAAMASELEAAGIPGLHSAGADFLHGLGNPWLFRIRPFDGLQTAAITRLLVEELRSRRPAIFYIQNDYGENYARTIAELLRRSGIEPILLAHTQGDNDLLPQVRSALDRGADALVSAGYVRDTALVLKARRATGSRVPLVGNSSLTIPATLALLEPEDLSGVIAMTDALVGAQAGARSAAFLRRYEEAYGFRPDAWSQAYYDAVMMATRALADAGPDARAVRAWFARLEEWPGLTRRFRADERGNLAHETLIVRNVPGTREWAYVSTFTEEDLLEVQSTAPVAAGGAGERRSIPWQSIVQTTASGLAIGSVYALMALGFVLVFQATGVVNFAVGQLVMLGAFLGVTTGSKLLGGLGGWAFALVLMTIAGVAFYLLVYRPLSRRPLVTVIVGTIAIGIVLQNLALQVFGALPRQLPSPFGSGTVELAGVSLSVHQLVTLAVTALAVAALYWLLFRTPLGIRVRAVAQDPDAARLMGINVAAVHLFTWSLAGALAGLAGLLLGPIWFVDASLGDPLALKAFASTIIGGFGSVPGAVLGGAVVGVTESLCAAYVSSAYKDAIVFGLMLAVLFVRPRGLLGEPTGDKS